MRASATKWHPVPIDVPNSKYETACAHDHTHTHTHTHAVKRTTHITHQRAHLAPESLRHKILLTPSSCPQVAGSSPRSPPQPATDTECTTRGKPEQPLVAKTHPFLRAALSTTGSATWQRNTHRSEGRPAHGDPSMDYLATSSVIMLNAVPCIMPPHTEPQQSHRIVSVALVETGAAAPLHNAVLMHPPSVTTSNAIMPHKSKLPVRGAQCHRVASTPMHHKHDGQRTRMFGPQGHQTQKHLPNTNKGGTSST